MDNTGKPIENGYVAEFDNVNRAEWYRTIKNFYDSNIYQTWAYDAVRCGERNTSHFVLRSGKDIVAAAQARVVRVPLIGLRAAYVRWGPLWQPLNGKKDVFAFRMAVRALRNEYVCKRGLILRIFPLLFDDDSNGYLEILNQEGFRNRPGDLAQRTLILDIQPELHEIRKNFDQKWRNCLNRAERNGLVITEGFDEEIFSSFISIYKELLDRKKFQEPNDINEFKRIQEDLPDEFKMKIFLCQSAGSNSAGAIFATIGNTGLYLFGATNANGMANKGSYLIQWRAIQWMKSSDCSYYNLNGINPTRNPGSYHFKAGVAGKKGIDASYLGRFDSYSSPMQAQLSWIGDQLLPRVRKLLRKIN